MRCPFCSSVDSKVVDSYKLAVMAAMNITDELFRLQESKGTTSKTLEGKADEWLRILDHALQPSSQGV